MRDDCNYGGVNGGVPKKTPKATPKMGKPKAEIMEKGPKSTAGSKGGKMK